MRSNVNSVLITFFIFLERVSHERVPRGQIVNRHFSLEVTGRIRENGRKQRLERWICDHDNALGLIVRLSVFMEKSNFCNFTTPIFTWPDFVRFRFIFPSWNLNLKSQKTSLPNNRRQWTIEQKPILRTLPLVAARNVFDGGKGVGGGVLLLSEIVLKAITCILNNIMLTKMYLKNPDTYRRSHLMSAQKFFRRTIKR